MALEETQNNGSAVAVAPKENAPPPLKQQQQQPQGQAQIQPSTSNEKLNNIVNGGGAGGGATEKSRSNNKQGIDDVEDALFSCMALFGRSVSSPMLTHESFLLTLRDKLRFVPEAEAEENPPIQVVGIN